MADGHSRSGFLGFLSTIPGIITAVAALLTAMATVAGVQLSAHDGGQVPPTPPAETHVPEPPMDPVPDTPTPASPAPEVVTSEPSPVPEAPTAVELPDLSMEEIQLEPQDPVHALLGECYLGDGFACAAALGLLAEECRDGNWASCDLLYEESPLDSAYEYYGATCGYRVDPSYAGYCSGP
jgi:hypothetical protein